MKGKLIKCKTCGAEIAKNANVCPHCGANLVFRKPGVWIGLVFWCLAIFCLFQACNALNRNSALVPTATPAVQPTTVVAITTPDVVQDYSDIESAFSSLFGDADITVVKKGSRLEVTVVCKGFATESEPENWDSIVDDFTIALADGKTAAEQYGFSELSGQIETEGGDILISGFGGDIKYDIFAPTSDVSGPFNGVTLAQFNSITTGMSYSQVCAVFGAGGELLSQVDIGDAKYKTEMYSWPGSGSIGANCNCTFQGGDLIAKAQFGLE